MTNYSKGFYEMTKQTYIPNSPLLKRLRALCFQDYKRAVGTIFTTVVLCAFLTSCGQEPLPESTHEVQYADIVKISCGSQYADPNDCEPVETHKERQIQFPHCEYEDAESAECLPSEIK